MFFFLLVDFFFDQLARILCSSSFFSRLPDAQCHFVLNCLFHGFRVADPLMCFFLQRSRDCTYVDEEAR